MISRGLRNRNPLNIRISKANRWQGRVPENTDGAFEQFLTMEYGFLAALKTLDSYIVRHGCNTIEQIITRWAPPTDGNDTTAYIRRVCNDTGIGGREPLSNHDPRLRNIVMAMARVECGEDADYYQADLNAAFQNFKPTDIYRRKR